MALSKPKLVYWDIRVFAEPIRLLLHYVGVDFEDVRIPMEISGGNIRFEAWTEQKNSHGLDFPNLPFYQDEDVKITQSFAILQHIARKYKLYGDTLKEAAVIDMVAHTIHDLRLQAWLIYNDKNYHKIKDDWKKTIPERLGEVEKFMKGKKFVLGDKISYVDFLLYESVQWYREFAPDLFEETEQLKNLGAFQKRIESLPQIKKYHESPKFKRFPLFAPVVYFGHSQDPDFKPIPISYRNFMAKYPLEPEAETWTAIQNK